MKLLMIQLFLVSGLITTPALANEIFLINGSEVGNYKNVPRYTACAYKKSECIELIEKAESLIGAGFGGDPIILKATCTRLDVPKSSLPDHKVHRICGNLDKKRVHWQAKVDFSK